MINDVKFRVQIIVRRLFFFSLKLIDRFVLFCFSGASTQLESIFSTVDRLQQNRLDDQRTALPRQSKTNSRLSPLNEQFFDQLAKCQVNRVIFHCFLTAVEFF